MAEFELDIGKLRKAMNLAPREAAKGVNTAMGDIKDDWVRESRDVAPLDKRNLRDQIHGSVKNPGLDSHVEIEANATQDTGGSRFNYGYYIHEGHMRADGKSLKTSGTVEKFLEEPAEKRKDKYKQWIEEEIKSALKRAGW